MTRFGDRYGRREFLSRGASLTALGIGGTVLGACGTSSSSSGKVSAHPGIGSGTPRRGGTITVGVASDIDGFSPASSHWDATGLTYANVVFDSLTAIANDGTARPFLAQSVTPNSDYTVWTLTLRPNVVFHDGSPLNGAVVVANINALRASPLTGQALSPVTSVTSPSTLTVVFTMSAPFVPFPYALSTQVGYIVGLSQLADKNGSQNPVGTGPFSIVNWTQNNEFVVKANPHYWQPGIPYLDGITFKPIVADATRENTLRSGGVDLMVTRDPTAIVDLGSDSQYQQVSALDQKIGEPDMDFIVLNTTVAPLSDLTVRQGLAYSLDVVTLGKLFGGGISKPSTSLFQEGSPYYAPNGYPEFDLTKGKALISQAKANHGGSISFSLETIPDPKLEAAVQAIQQMWNQAGCDVTIGTIQQVDLIQNMATGINFQAYTSEQFGAFDPDLNYVWWDSSSAKGPIALNFARNQDPQIDAALTLGRTSADPATRIKAYQTVDQRLAADLPYLWLRIAPWSMTASTKVQNFANAGLPDGSHGFPFNGGVFNPTAIWLQG